MLRLFKKRLIQPENIQDDYNPTIRKSINRDGGDGVDDLPSDSF